MKPLFSLLVVLFGYLNQCSQEPVGPQALPVALGQEFRLPLYHTARISLPAGEGPVKLEVRLERVQDSRCPADVVCFTAGAADIQLAFSDGDGNRQHLNLCLGECRSASGELIGYKLTDTASVTLGGSTYTVKLQEIGPYPQGKKQDPDQEKKWAALVVQRA